MKRLIRQVGTAHPEAGFGTFTGGTMFVCGTCNKLERQCKCDRFCMLCQSDYQVRLCEDGFYYCKDCRDACDFRSEE